MKTFTIFLALLIAQSAFVFGQDTIAAKPGTADADPGKISKELKAEAVDFLRATAAEVNNMRTLENRISFSAEMAGLMWFTNERDARAMYQTVINDFRQLLAQHDAALNAFTADSDKPSQRVSRGSAQAKTVRKFMKALSVRQQITSSLAEHDPQLAFEFFTETAQAISNPEMRERTAQSDSYFESRLLQQVAEKDVDTALKYGRKNLEKGINYETLSLLRKIYDKDADKGIGFGEDIISKLISDSSKSQEFYVLSSLIDFGEETIEISRLRQAGDARRPVFSEQNLREIAEILAQRVLNSDDDSDRSQYLSVIEKYAPSRAVQIRSKFGIKKSAAPAGGLTTKAGTGVGIPEPKEMPEESVEERLAGSLEELGNKELSGEERQKVIEQSRKIIVSIDDPNQKIMALSGLAVQVAQLGDKQLAIEILEDARGLINPQPVNYLDYMESWILITGYSQIDAPQAFPMLESTIYRLNDTISAFVKVGEFIDVEGDMVEDGEIQLGSFGGGFTRELLGMIGVASPTVKNLAVADFKRTKDLTNRFDRQEVRILAKMLVLRAILGNDQAKTSTNIMDF
ncbi:MAG: hypothetical protein KIS76_07660 [Pyrinomonadaceae bacterium]|nr:hypothetical protein [Pyrinomonadaceae bacterium]